MMFYMILVLMLFAQYRQLNENQRISSIKDESPVQEQHSTFIYRVEEAKGINLLYSIKVSTRSRILRKIIKFAVIRKNR